MTSPQSILHPVSELVRRRYSCRSFDGAGIEAGLLERIERLFPSLTAPFVTPLRFGIIDRERIRADNLFSSGTYGMIRGVRHFASAIIPATGERRWEDFGFAMETLVLHITALGLQSCWIGGVFDRKRFGRDLRIGENEQLPAVIAMGHAADRRTLRDRIVRRAARGDQRKPGTGIFFDGSFDRPLEPAAGPELAEALDNVRRAPSASNKQPWRLLRSGQTLHLYLARDAAYSRIIPGVDLQRIDAGIAMSHLTHTLAEKGTALHWLADPPSLPRPAENWEYIASAVMP
jgi:nitroreductase